MKIIRAHLVKYLLRKLGPIKKHAKNLTKIPLKFIEGWAKTCLNQVGSLWTQDGLGPIRNINGCGWKIWPNMVGRFGQILRSVKREKSGELLLLLVYLSYLC